MWQKWIRQLDQCVLRRYAWYMSAAPQLYVIRDLARGLTNKHTVGAYKQGVSKPRGKRGEF